MKTKQMDAGTRLLRITQYSVILQSKRNMG